jgi:hypothetical protein
VSTLDPLPGKGTAAEQAEWRAERRASDAELAPYGLGGAAALEHSLRLRLKSSEFWANELAASDPERARTERERANRIRQMLITAGLTP